MVIAVMSVGTFVVVWFGFDRSFESARTAVFTVLVLSHLLYAFAVLHDVFDTTSLTVAGWLLCLSAALVAPIGILLASQFAHADPRRGR